MGYLPGMDSLLVYDTTKIVQIRDKRLGAIYYSLLGLTIAFVVGYEILYCNDHFERRDVKGTPQLSIQQPTVNACNPSHADCYSDFMPLGDLPYCDVYQGNSSAVAAENRHECIFADKFTLSPYGASEQGLLLPTRIDRMNETRLCRPSLENNYTCLNEFQIAGTTGIRYVADIERYTLLLAHSYGRDTIRGNNNNLMGYYNECIEPRGGLRGGLVASVSQAVFGRQECPGGSRSKPIPCLPSSDCSERQGAERPDSTEALLQRTSGSSQQRAKRRQPAGALEVDAPPEPTPEVYAITDGDVFTIAKLLELAGASLDDTNGENEPLRSAGSILDIRVVYDNMHPFSSTFGNTAVGYEYHVALRPLHQFKEEIVSWVSADNNRRSIENRHGLFVVVQVGGSFGFFSIMNLLLMLTTAAAILGVATVLTDKIALKLMESKDFYASKKYEIAEAPEEGGDI